MRVAFFCVGFEKRRAAVRPVLGTIHRPIAVRHDLDGSDPTVCNRQSQNLKMTVSNRNIEGRVLSGNKERREEFKDLRFAYSLQILAILGGCVIEWAI